MLAHLYKKLSNLSHQQLANMLCEMWETVEHNYYIYSNYISADISNADLLKTINESFDK
jgi:hypothetical protein